MANLFKMGRSLIEGTKSFGKSFVPPKKVEKPGKEPLLTLFPLPHPLQSCTSIYP